MRKTWLVLAVLLAGDVAVCRAADKKGNASPAASPYAAKDAIVPVDSPEAMKDEGKDYVEPVDAKDVGPAPAPAAAPKSGIIWAAPDRCRCGRGAEGYHHFCDWLHRRWEWLTYRPLSQPGIAGCCNKCGGCHVPPLYLYFLDPYHACAPGNDGWATCATCAAPGCAGSTHP